MSAVSPTSNRSISMPGLLALSCGLCMIFVYIKFPQVSQITGGFARLVYWALAVTLALGGARMLWDARNGPQGGQQRSGLGRNRIMLPREGLVYLVIMAVLFIGALIGHSNMLMLVFAMMAGPWILNGWTTFSMLKRTTAQRKAPPRAMVGQPFSVEMVLENRSRWVPAWLMVVRDQIQNDRERLEAGVLFTRVPHRDRRSAHYQLLLSSRGRYTLGPIQVLTRFPLGLIERGLIFDSAEEILIHPRIGHLTPRWKRERSTATELVQQTRPRMGVFHDEYHRIREYRAGDNPRAIHWRTSARRGELMVREFQQNREQNLHLVLDLWAPPNPTEAQRQRVELAASFAATVCLDHLRNCRGSRLLLTCSGDRVVHWEGQAGPANIEALLDLLALAQSGGSAGLTEALSQAVTQSTAMTRVVLVTTQPREQANGGTDGHSVRGVDTIEADPGQLEAYFQLE